MLKLKLKYFGLLMRRTDSLEKTLMLEKMKAGGRGTTENEMVGWHHDSMNMSLSKLQELAMDREALVSCSPWGSKKLDMTEWLNWYMSDIDWTYQVAEYDDLARLREKSEQNCNFIHLHFDLSPHFPIWLHSLCHTTMTSFLSLNAVCDLVLLLLDGTL